ncbi:uncharacterized protein LOC117484395 isoform X1 [Trematomus bernacchii]|uniref:uncharacterized protein LOC117484395 isoform X1 n=1 Tax=Trematomus bernacchii TaxID=40690 RepID=UPI00146C0AB1|nr:uncharacterized protein LOC117484395 isoform X1 [Trematomus bernacchii]
MSRRKQSKPRQIKLSYWRLKFRKLQLEWKIDNSSTVCLVPSGTSVARRKTQRTTSAYQERRAEPRTQMTQQRGTAPAPPHTQRCTTKKAGRRTLDEAPVMKTRAERSRVQHTAAGRMRRKERKKRRCCSGGGQVSHSVFRSNQNRCSDAKRSEP